MKTPVNIDVNKFVQDVLYKEYKSEFEVIDRMNQHPAGINFYQWLCDKGYITVENNTEIQKEIDAENIAD